VGVNAENEYVRNFVAPKESISTLSIEKQCLFKYDQRFWCAEWI